MSKDTKVLEVANFLNKNPKATGRQVAKHFKVALSYGYVLMSKARAIKKEADEVVAEVSHPVHTGYKDTIKEVVARIDAINHPPHYKVGGIETIDFIEAKQLDYHLGNVVKYITRSNYKGSKLDDLKKAQWYLNRAVENESAKS